MFFRKKIALIISALILSFIFCTNNVRAMPIGTLLYRTSSNGNLYGYNTTELVVVKNKMIKNIYTGHVAIYVGKENGVDYIVEAMPDGVIKIPAKYFLNSRNGEKLIGAKIPKNLTEIQKIKIMELSKKIANSNLAYDFDFKKQKGPKSGEWICVGLTEKIYESANIKNPLDLSQLQYDPRFYAINITPDGFDNYSIFNEDNGDCLSKNLEFSKIKADNRTIIPLPEIFGFNAGREYDGERYFFFPITQYWQKNLMDVDVDIQLESDFFDDDIRGRVPELSMIFKWSFINNPSSSINNLVNKISSIFFKNQNDKNLIDLSVDKNDLNNKENLSIFSDDNNSGYEISSSSGSGSFPDSNSVSGSDKVVLGKTQSSIIIEKNDSPNNINISDNINNSNILENINDSSSNNSNNSVEGDSISTQLNDFFKKIVISRVYATLNDDYIEIYNPTDQAINLEELGFRLYKTKTSATPTLMARIGNLSDGVYPGGVIILPKSKYLIARSGASEKITSRAQAIINKSEFTFTGNAYTIYLSFGVVSSDNDEDIIDKVGFGDARYFEGQPALEILDNHVLVRKAKINSTSSSMKDEGSDFNLGNSYDSNDNSFDFVLISLSSDQNLNNNPNNTDNIIDNLDNNFNNDLGDSLDNNHDNDLDNSNNNSSINDSNDNENVDNVINLPILISRIYATLSDDYVELYNPNNFNINLESESFRLYKTKTSATPSLMMRIGNLSDGVYPGGVIINSKSNYLIARSEASDEIKLRAQAISSRSEFTFTGNAYTIYLGKGVVSSDSDEDIVDKVGFGGATYYFNSPANEIYDHHVLTRKAYSNSTAADMSFYGSHYNLGNSFNSNNNNFDFVLLDSNYDYSSDFNNNGNESNNQNENNDSEDGDNGDNSENNDDNEYVDNEGNNEEGVDDSGDENEETQEDENNNGWFLPYCINPGFYLDNIIHLWHLDECSSTSTYDFINNQETYISSIWQEGKFGCGLKQYFNQPALTTNLHPSFDPNNFTLSFYYQNLFTNSRPMFRFSNSLNGNFFRVKLYPYYTDFYNVPGVDTRVRSLQWLNDSYWHLFSWVVNKADGYWAFYNDGIEVYRADISNKIFFEVDTFSIKGDNNYNLMDEITIFNRALSSEEIFQINELDLPLNSFSCLGSSNNDIKLLNYWNFEDLNSDIAHDLIGSSSFSIPVDQRDSVSGNAYIKINNNNDIFSELPSYNFYQKPLSMSFWWKTESNEVDFESLIKLMCGNYNVFGVNISKNNLYHYFNNTNSRINSENFQSFPENSWQHFVLAYDPYWLRLSLYINGQNIENWRKNWINSCFVNKVMLNAWNQDYSLDELGIWRGYLDINSVQYIYNQQKDLFID